MISPVDLSGLAGERQVNDNDDEEDILNIMEGGV